LLEEEEILEAFRTGSNVAEEKKRNRTLEKKRQADERRMQLMSLRERKEVLFFNTCCYDIGR